MNRKGIYNIAFGVAGLVLAGGCFAQDTSKVTFNVGAGFTEPVGPSNRRVDMGFNMGAGVGYNFAPHVGIQAEFGYNQLGLQSSLLNTIGVPSGETRIYSVTLNPIVHLNPHGRFDAYLVGGGGYYRRTVEFTRPTINTIVAFDPFFGFFPVDVPADEVLGSFTQNKGGLNVGAGVSFRVKGDSNAKFFAESRYHYLFTSPVRTSVLPVTFGVRW